MVNVLIVHISFPHLIIESVHRLESVQQRRACGADPQPVPPWEGRKGSHQRKHFSAFEMKVYEHNDPNSTEPRSHPWNVAEHDPTQKYYDFRETPELIRTSLEDFKPWDGYAAIEVFYRLLEWLNGPDSTLESNDCAFRAPTTNINPHFTKRLQCSGRMMILYRDLKVNTFPEFIRWLVDASRHYLERTDPDFQFGVVGTTIMQVNFITLPPPRSQSGQELQLSFWAWGDSEIEAMTNLERTFQNIDIALRGVSDEIRQSAQSAT